MEYYTASWTGIKKIEIERESDNSIWIKGRRSNKLSSWGSGYFPTYNEARQYLISEQQKKIDSAKSTLIYQEENMAILLDKIPPNQ